MRHRGHRAAAGSAYLSGVRCGRAPPAPATRRARAARCGGAATLAAGPGPWRQSGAAALNSFRDYSLQYPPSPHLGSRWRRWRASRNRSRGEGPVGRTRTGNGRPRAAPEWTRLSGSGRGKGGVVVQGAVGVVFHTIGPSAWPGPACPGGPTRVRPPPPPAEPHAPRSARVPRGSPKYRPPRTQRRSVR